MKLDDLADVVVRLEDGKREFTTLRQGLLYCWAHIELVRSFRCNGIDINVGGELWKKGG